MRLASTSNLIGPYEIGYTSHKSELILDSRSLATLPGGVKEESGHIQGSGKARLTVSRLGAKSDMVSHSNAAADLARG